MTIESKLFVVSTLFILSLFSSNYTHNSTHCVYANDLVTQTDPPKRAWGENNKEYIYYQTKKTYIKMIIWVQMKTMKMKVSVSFAVINVNERREKIIKKKTRL